MCGLAQVIDADPEMTSDERADVEFEVAGRLKTELAVSLRCRSEFAAEG